MKRIFLIELIIILIISNLIVFYIVPTKEQIPQVELTVELETEPTTTPTTEPVVIAHTTEPVIITEDWFNDALFIGDSRTVGMRAVRRLGEADYFCKSSMSTFTALVWETSDKRFQDENLRYVLSNFKYKKIFIELGINECGYDHELVIDAYQDIIDLIREYQTDPIIIVQSVITVSKEKASDEQFTLERITNLNKLIYEMAQDNGLYYIDTNEFAADENGYLRSDLSNDGCHFHEIGSEEWIKFIIEKSAEINVA